MTHQHPRALVALFSLGVCIAGCSSAQPAADTQGGDARADGQRAEDATPPDAPAADIGVVDSAGLLCSGEAWCWLNPLPQGHDLTAVWGRGEQKRWAVGASGTIIASDDGGATFVRRASGTGAGLFGIWGDDKVLVAVGAGATVARSDDGGAAWSAQVLPQTDKDLRAVWSGAGTMIVVGRGGFIGRSRDGGKSFEARPSQTSADLSSVWVSADGKLVVAVGAGATIVRSDDGGESFAAASGGSGELADVWGRPDASAIFAVGTSGALRSLDAGKTFGALAPTPAGVNLMNEVWGLADGEIVVLAARQHALDEGRVLRSVGLAGSASATPSWTRVTVDDEPQLLGLWGSPGGKLLAAGRYGAVRAASASASAPTMTSPLAADGARDDVTGLWAGQGLVVAAAGASMLRSDDGRRFTRVALAGTRRALSVSGAADGTLYASGTRGLLLRSSDGGRSWDEQVSGTTQQLGAVGGTPAGDVFAIGSGTVLRRDAASGGWSAETLPAAAAGRDLRALWADSSSGLWVVGNAATILYRDAAGVWSTRDSGVSALAKSAFTLSAIVGFDDGKHLVAGSLRGAVLVSDDGGQRWREVKIALSRVSALWIDAAGVLHAASDSSCAASEPPASSALSTCLASSRDQGASFSPEPTGVGGPFTALGGNGWGRYAAGRGGAIVWRAP